MEQETYDGLVIAIWIIAGLFVVVQSLIIKLAFTECRNESSSSVNYTGSEDMLNALQKGQIISMVILLLLNLTVLRIYLRISEIFIYPITINEGWHQTWVIANIVITLIVLIVINASAMDEYNSTRGWDGIFKIRKLCVTKFFQENDYQSRLNKLKTLHKKQIT